jgi:hypothetical protein
MTCYHAARFIIAASMTIIATPARAQSANDVQCLLASNAASKLAKEPDAKRAAEATLHFYLGRIDGKYSDAQLAAAFTSQLPSLAGASVGPIMQACFQYAQQKMKVVQTVGEQLSRSPKK